MLYRSLSQVCDSFRLWVFCMDDRTAAALRAFELPHAEIVTLDALEGFDAALLGVKPDRNPVEYCWTATPAVCLYAFAADPEIEQITYLDADVRFYSDPAPLFAEIGDAAIAIVPHRYAPDHVHAEAVNGTYNVEWVTFKRDSAGLEALNWWHGKCIEWCYQRVEDGKMGDQKYLDDWPERFDRAHVVQHPGAGLAPWNVSAHQLSDEGGVPQVDGRPLIFYHYHSLRLFAADLSGRAAVLARQLRRPVPGGTALWLSAYPIGDDERTLLWEPYLQELEAAERDPRAAQPGLSSSVGHWSAAATAGQVRRAIRYRAADVRRAMAERLHATRWSKRETGNYEESWKDADVARQMIALTERELEDPGSSAPFRAFVGALPNLVAAIEGVPQPAQFLDIGCGIGGYGELLDRHAPGLFAYVGADFSPAILSAARTRSPSQRFVEINLFETGALDGHDVVFASGLVDVLPDPVAALEALFASDAPVVFLHRQQISDAAVSVRVVPGYRGQKTYRSYVPLDDLERIIASSGRRIEWQFRVADGIHSFITAPGESS